MLNHENNTNDNEKISFPFSVLIFSKKEFIVIYWLLRLDFLNASTCIFIKEVR